MEKKYLSLRVEESLFKEFKDVCYKLGMKHSTAINLFIAKCIKLDNLPFSLSETVQSSYIKIKKDDQIKRVSILVKGEDYQKFTEICKEIGISKGAATRIFMLRCIDKDGIPFDVN